MSYRTLEIWQLARDVSKDVHKMTLTKLPKFELYEEGSRIRRSCKSVRANIVEGYGRRDYKQDFVRFLTFALSSNDETTDHLECLFETESLTDEISTTTFMNVCKCLAESSTLSGNPSSKAIAPTNSSHPETSIYHPASRPEYPAS